MLIKRFYDAKLAQASFLVGCQATGEALVIDPDRDIDQYLEGATKEGLRITHVTETHIHADFVSGSRELAKRTGARLYLSGEGGSEWRYAFAAGDGAIELQNGDHFLVGHIRLSAVHTPGHTPEHLTFLVTDTPATDHPMGAFTGDFIFAGDVGRPDLLEKAAGHSGTMREAARTLFRSLQQFKRLPDYLQLWPGHGAGSACGKSLGAVPSTTLGYERIANWGVGLEDEEEFVRMILAGQPEPPSYFAVMKRVNRDGPRILGAMPTPPRLPDDRLAALVRAGALVVDTRPAADFAAGHIPGTINVPLDRSFPTWMGWLVPYDRDFHLIIDDADDQRVREAVRDLVLIGLERIGGIAATSAVERWRRDDGRLQTTPQMSVAELAEQRGEVAVIDVRGRSEWENGHLEDVPNIPVGYLADELDRIPRDRPVVVHCQSGARSSIAASVLRAHGLENVVNLEGGFAAWQRAGQKVSRETAAAR